MLAEPLERRRDMVARRNKEIAGKGAMIICGMDFVMRPWNVRQGKHRRGSGIGII